MKRAIFVLAVLVLALVGGAAAYQAVAQHNYSTLLTRGDNALRDDQAVNAIEAYSGAIALRPSSMLAYFRRGQTYQRRGERGDLEAAARDFRTAASLDPAATRPLEALGDVLFQSQQYERAVSAYERCVRLDDRSARVSYKLALRRGSVSAWRLPARAAPRAGRHQGARACGRALTRPGAGARGARRPLRLARPARSGAGSAANDRRPGS